MSINNEDLMLVNRGNTDHKVTIEDLRAYINAKPVPTFVTAAVGTEKSNWSPYAQILEYPSNDPVDPSKYHDYWNWKAKHRNPDNLFNGVHDVKDDQFGYTVKDYYKTHLTFSYPNGIQVYDSIEFKGGFYKSPLGDGPEGPCNIGTVSINGVDVLDLAADDVDPQEFIVPYTGTLTQFSIRQKNAACDGPRDCGYYSHLIAYIKIDGKELLNQTATTLEFEPGEFFDQLKIGTKLRQVSPKVTGVVSKIYYGENKVVLDDTYLGFRADSTVIIVGADPESKARVPNQFDRLLVNRGGTDYQTTTEELKEYITSMPWEGDDYCIFHVKNATAEITLNGTRTAWDIDGTNERELRTIQPGEEVVFVTDTEPHQLFDSNHSANWEFGELTDVSKGKEIGLMFHGCFEFNADISDWNTSSAVEMTGMFDGCTKFNQDLSQWCVTDVKISQDQGEPHMFSYDCESWEGKNKPVWGTCPRGEDQK